MAHRMLSSKAKDRADSQISQFSPVPYRVIDGSEEGPTVPAAVLSGAPVDLQARTVR